MSDYKRVLWYIQHRIEFLDKQQLKLKATLEQSPPNAVDFDDLGTYMEHRGALKELRQLMERLQDF